VTNQQAQAAPQGVADRWSRARVSEQPQANARKSPLSSRLAGLVDQRVLSPMTRRSTRLTGAKTADTHRNPCRIG